MDMEGAYDYGALEGARVSLSLSLAKQRIHVYSMEYIYEVYPQV
jgi:hypothetical protein